MSELTDAQRLLMDRQIYGTAYVEKVNGKPVRLDPEKMGHAPYPVMSRSERERIQALGDRLKGLGP